MSMSKPPVSHSHVAFSLWPKTATSSAGSDGHEDGGGEHRWEHEVVVERVDPAGSAPRAARRHRCRPEGTCGPARRRPHSISNTAKKPKSWGRGSENAPRAYTRGRDGGAGTARPGRERLGRGSGSAHRARAWFDGGGPPGGGRARGLCRRPRAGPRRELEGAGGEGGERTVELAFGLAAGVLEVVIVDDAPPFDARQVPEPDTETPIEERKIGGLGVAITRRLMDGIEYERRDGMNRLVLRKRMAPAGGAG